MTTAVQKKYDHMYGKDPYSIPLEDYDVSQPELFESNTMWGFFDRLRKEDPVHYCKDSENGPYWSVTKFKDIMEVEGNPEVYSSEPTISLVDPREDFKVSMFIAMDEPRHGEERRTVQGVVAPANLARMEPLIRERVCGILDSLPVNETFNWVDKVSIELTTQMLATLFDFPFEQRRKLTYWSDVATTVPAPGALVESIEERQGILINECLPAFTKLWNERVNAPPQFDLISMLAHGESTRHMQPFEFLGNLMLLIIGGNDTTRNSLSGGVLALNENPEQYQKLRDNPGLIPKLVPEIIRWQTPLTFMRRPRPRTPSCAASGSRRVTRLSCGMYRATVMKRSLTVPTSSSSTGRTRVTICRSALASTAAWATGLPRCNCASYGKRCSSASTRLR
jgi:cytochrome P450